MYTNKRDDEDINHVRKILFCQKGRAIEHIPPTALIQHIKRAIYQGCICWGQCIIANQQLPCPSEWGWTKGTTWQPHWTTLSDASTTCRELLSPTAKAIVPRNVGAERRVWTVQHSACVETTVPFTPWCNHP